MSWDRTDRLTEKTLRDIEKSNSKLMNLQKVPSQQKKNRPNCILKRVFRDSSGG